jgi:hypothetical protein
LLKAGRGCIIFLSCPGCSLILIHMCTFCGQPHTLLMVICYAILWMLLTSLPIWNSSCWTSIL